MICFGLLGLAKNCFVSLRPKRAMFALSPGQRPVVLVQIGKLRPTLQGEMDKLQYT